jgi:hypothetical protein
MGGREIFRRRRRRRSSRIKRTRKLRKWMERPWKWVGGRWI